MTQQFRWWTSVPAALTGMALAGLVAASSAVAQQKDDSFYQGKTMQLLIGYGPGSGYDVYGRLLGRHIGRHIPGNPTIVPQNMPGAAGLNMANHLYNVAPKDGTAIGMVTRTLIVESLMGNEQSRFDARKFSWLGSLSETVSLCFTWAASGIDNIEQAKHREVLVGSTGSAAASTIYPRALNALLGTKFKVITGYPDSGAIGLAMERGEVQGYCSFTWVALKAARPDWLKEKKVNFLLQLSTAGNPELKGVPVVVGLAKDDDVRRQFEFLFTDQGMAQPVAGPPDVPADRLAILRAAFNATVKDEAFLAEAEKQRTEISPVTAENVQKLVERIYATPPELIARVREITAGKETAASK